MKRRRFIVFCIVLVAVSLVCGCISKLPSNSPLTEQGFPLHNIPKATDELPAGVAGGHLYMSWNEETRG